MAQRQSRTRRLGNLRRRMLRQPWFGLLEKAGYQTNTDSADEAITQLVIFSIFCAAVPLLIGLLILGAYSVLTTLGLNPKDDFAPTTLIPVSLGVIATLISFDSIKEVISKEVMALNQKLTPEQEELEVLRKENEALKSSNDYTLQQEQKRYYHARTYVADNEEIDWVSFERQAYPTHQLQYTNIEEAKAFLEKTYADREARRKLRLAITKIQRESWIKLASNAVVVALDLREEDLEKQSQDLKIHQFFSDIYLYLDAWLVSSIDNDVAIAIPYMPIEYIGVNYPSTQEPDIEAYNKALDFLIKVFDKRKVCQLISEVQLINEQEIETYREVTPYLRELMVRINDLVNSKDVKNRIR